MIAKPVVKEMALFFLFIAPFFRASIAYSSIYVLIFCLVFVSNKEMRDKNEVCLRLYLAVHSFKTKNKIIVRMLVVYFNISKINISILNLSRQWQSVVLNDCSCVFY